MNARQRNKMRMVLATQAVLLQQRNAWAAHEAFAEAVDALTEAIGDMEKAHQRQIARDGATQSKETATSDLGEIAYEVAGATFACADHDGDTALAARVAYGRWEVMSGSYTAIHARCMEIRAAATEVQARLPKYGITAARLRLLKERIDSYARARTRPRERRVETVAVTRALSDALADATRLLKNQLDKLIVQFEATAPHFVAQYRAARWIVNLRGTATPASASEKATAQSTPVVVSDALPAPAMDTLKVA